MNSPLPTAAKLGAALLLLIVLAVLLGPVLSPYAADSIDFDAPWGTPPALARQHWWGSDSLGRDLFVRCLAGGRVSLAVAVLATGVSLGIGVLYGAVAGFVGGKLDELMMRTVDILYALPFLFLVMLLMVLLGRSMVLVFVAIGLIHWLDMARIVRGQVLALKAREFVQAARVSGESEAAILWRHILPNVGGVVAGYVTVSVPQVILAESFLSFLGLGAPDSWGALINEGARQMHSAPWALAFPAGLMVLTLLALNLLGDALRERLQ